MALASNAPAGWPPNPEPCPEFAPALSPDSCDSVRPSEARERSASRVDSVVDSWRPFVDASVLEAAAALPAPLAAPLGKADFTLAASRCAMLSLPRGRNPPPVSGIAG